MPLTYEVLIQALDAEGGFLWSESRAGTVPTTEDAEANALRIAGRLLEETEGALEHIRGQIATELPTLSREQARVDAGQCPGCGHAWEDHDGEGCGVGIPAGAGASTCPCPETR